MKTYVILPALNEKDGLPGLLARLSLLDTQVIVVDDGSTDSTADVVRSQVGPRLVRFPRNRGVGSALLAGFELVCAEAGDFDLCFTMDADDTQDPGLIPRMVPLLRNGADIVIASRYRPGGGVTGCTTTRVLLSTILSRLMASLFRIEGVTDYSTFYRGYRVGVIRRTLERHGRTLLAGRGFEANTDLLIKAASLASRIEEVPLLLEYGRKLGTSKMKPVRTMLHTLLMAARNVDAAARHI